MDDIDKWMDELWNKALGVNPKQETPTSDKEKTVFPKRQHHNPNQDILRGLKLSQEAAEEEQSALYCERQIARTSGAERAKWIQEARKHHMRVVRLCNESDAALGKHPED